MSLNIEGGQPVGTAGVPFLTKTGVGVGATFVIILIAQGVDDDFNPTTTPTITPPAEGTVLFDFVTSTDPTTRIFGQAIPAASGADLSWTSDIEAWVHYRLWYSDDTLLAEVGSELVPTQSAWADSSSTIEAPALTYTNTATNVYFVMLATDSGSSLHGIHLGSTPDGGDQDFGTNPVQITYLNHTRTTYGPETFGSGPSVADNWGAISFGWQVPKQADWLVNRVGFSS